jgi:16S rRNA (uracil1498-N3)-methyltransferase
LGLGDDCEVVVGAAVYAATVSGDGSPVKVRLVRLLEGPEAGARYRTRVGLVQALTRPTLVDLIVEKGTEAGASSFMLFPSAGSPPGGSRRDAAAPGADRLSRWRRIALEAAKQSKQTAVPSVEPAGSLEDALNRLGGRETTSLVLQPSASLGLFERLSTQQVKSGPVALWVGPESGWTEAETRLLAASGAEAVRLGQSVLRSETAGPVAVAIARLALGDW